MKKLALTTSMALLLAAPLLSACGTSQEPDYFTLTPVSGAAKPAISVSLKVERPVLAGYLDRPEFSRQIDVSQVLVDNTDYWAEPLDKMVAHILADDLQQRLPASVINANDNYVAPDARYTIDVNLTQFNLVDGDRVVLTGHVTAQDRLHASSACLWPVQGNINSGSSPSAVAEGLSALIGKLADDIAQKMPLNCP